MCTSFGTKVPVSVRMYQFWYKCTSFSTNVPV